MSSELLGDSDQALSTRARAHYWNMQAKYSEIKGDFKRCHECSSRFVETMESNESILRLNLMGYMHSLYNLMVSCVRLARIDDFHEHLSRFRNIPKKYPKDCSSSLATTIRYYAVNLEFFMLLGTRRIRKAHALAVQIGERLEAEKSQAHLIYLDLCYFLAYANFGFGDYHAAIKWLTPLLHRADSEVREDLSAYARILLLLCHMELENDELVWYNLRSTYRYLTKKESVYRFEDAILRFLRLQLRSGELDLKEGLTKLRNELLTEKADPFEQNAMLHFDLLSWLEAKVQGRTFLEVVENKSTS